MQAESLLDHFRSELSRVIPATDVRKVMTILLRYADKLAVPKAADSATVLETFDGFVDRIEGQTAFVTIQSRENGDVEAGTYSAPELGKLGIQEQSCFVFKTVKVGDAIRPVFEPVPQEAIADEVVREIDAMIDKALPREDPGIRY